MKVGIKQLFDFGEGYPPATAGVFLPEDGIVITGHANGFVVRWDIRNPKPDKLYECASSVETIAVSPERQVAVGCNSGLLFTFSLDDPKSRSVIQDASYSKYSRIWRATWPTADRLLITSTYGVVNAFTKGDTGWQSIGLSGHSNSVFAIASHDGLLATGDYRGNIVVWESKTDRYEKTHELTILQAVEGIAWRGNETLATIGYSGHINLIEKNAQTGQWQSIVEADVARTKGTAIHITDDGKSAFAGTSSEVIQFDLDSQQLQQIDIPGTIGLFSKGNNVFVLTQRGLFVFARSQIVVPLSLVKYQYAKVSLVGHTGVGKSTLCSSIATGSAKGLKSTFGRRIWNWVIPAEGDIPERRIIFHDHGGQETVLATFLPFLTDSDIVMVLFKQTDKNTFDKAKQLLRELATIARGAKVLLVQTYVDHDVKDVTEADISDLISTGNIIGPLDVCPPDGRGVEALKGLLVDEVYWQNAKTMIQSTFVEGLTKTISQLLQKNASLISFEDFRREYEGAAGFSIAKSHLKFLLSNYSNQGLIEYYPDVFDYIILYDEEYNKLRSTVPTWVREKNGIVSIDYILAKSGRSKYVGVLDAVYSNYGICIRNRELRIFPRMLRSGEVSIPNPCKALLSKPLYSGELDCGFQETDIGRLIEALAELNVGCIDATKTEGVFSFERNACLYYVSGELGDAIRGRFLRFTYLIGGEDKGICTRLRNDFEAIIRRLYGPPAERSSELKKKQVKTPEFDVALSFAGEQRPYVDEVAAILSGKGIKVFYDEFCESHLWGKDLTEYLNEVYYSKARWCIMFISKEYMSKMWPVHERKSALARQVKQLGGYILPVRFDDTEVPGLQPTVVYQDARKRSPKDIAELFLKKLKEEVRNSASDSVMSSER